MWNTPISHIQNQLYQSDNTALNKLDLIRKLNIKAVLRLDYAYGPYQWPEEFTQLYLPFLDGALIPPNYFPQATTFIHQHIDTQKSVLVHCQAGISRSTTIILAYLIEHQGMCLEDAAKLVVEKRKIVRPHPSLLRSLVLHYDHLPYTPEEASKHDFWKQLIAKKN